MSGDRSPPGEAQRGADRYIHESIDRRQPILVTFMFEQGGQFWTDFAPKWIDLFELYEETHEPKYLKAAAAGRERIRDFRVASACHTQ